MENNDISFFAETTFRNLQRKFGIKTDDRRRHMYIIGKTGMGKTNMMENMAIQDIQMGKGVGFVDPHGEAAEKLLDFVPPSRINDVVYFNPGDLEFPIAFNVMEKVDIEHRHLVSSGLMGVFKKIWPDVWSARMEYILNNAILALLEYPGSTLLGINRMLADPEYRKKVVDKITDPVAKAFWTTEYARYTQRYEVEATAAIQNKVGQFISAPLIRNIIGQVQSSINMREVMDSGKILILNLSKGRVGEDNSKLLGALMITKLQLAAMSRVDVPEEKRRDFFLYVDEFQNFATESFATILSEARKYRLSLILGHQYITQMEEMVRDAVFGNVGTIVSFRVGAEDAEWLEKEFNPEFLATDFVNLGKYNIYIRLMIDGLASRPFSAITLSPTPEPEQSSREKIIKVSRERYSTPRAIVEDKIARWAGVKDSETVSTASVPERERYLPASSGTVLYDAKCSMCEKWTKVIFPPDANRPLYCKTCLKKIKKPRPREEILPERQREEKFEQLPTISLKEVGRIEPSSFSRSDHNRPRRKEVNVEELKEILSESLNKPNISKPENRNENAEGL